MTARQLAFIVFIVCTLGIAGVWYSPRAHSPVTQAERVRFPVQYGDLWGYIDVQGEIRIEPQFLSAQDFNEGFAAVRREGLYGYIDSTGAFVIAEQFDFAEPFHYGKARVYINGRPYYIDRSGKLLFEHAFEELEDFGQHGYTIARTATHKYCLLDDRGKMITDTVFEAIHSFSEGLASAYVNRSWAGNEETGRWDTSFTACVIDTSGNWKVLPGKYTRITRFSEGKAHAERLEKDSSGSFNAELSEFINAKGEVVFSIVDAPYTVYGSDGFVDGKLIVSVWDSARDNRDPGVIDEHGNLLFTNADSYEITSYCNGIAFADMPYTEAWSVIDEDGENITPYAFSNLYISRRYEEHPDVIFEYGTALAGTGYNWFLIDTNAKQIDTSVIRFSQKQEVAARTSSSIVFYDTAWSLWMVHEHRFLQGQYDWIDQQTMDDSLIRVEFEGAGDEWGYVNRNGEVIWKHEETDVERGLLNIDYMNSGYFHASGPFNPETEWGGWWLSENSCRSLDTIQSVYTQGKPGLYIDTTRTATWEEVAAGYRVYFLNDSVDTLFFSAQNSRINAVMQAKDRNGVWRNIEYLPSSWCGNGYHTLWLPPRYYWEFTVPQYTGVQSTRLRIEITYREREWRKGERKIYSNEISGSVNPAQFWRKREYFPNGIMDSYSE